VRGICAFSDPILHFNKLYDIALRDIHKQSSPGHCSLAKLGSSNKVVLGLEDDGTYDPVRYQVVRTTVFKRYQELLNGTYVSDPIKLFIKVEPIKKEKFDDDRFRLISSVSLEDNFIDRILFTPLFKKFLRNYRKTGLYVGYSPLKGGHLLINLIYNGNEKYLMIDKTAFDWTVHKQLLMIARDYILGCITDPPEWWKEAVKQRFEDLFGRPYFIFSDGTKIQQLDEGVMKSGCFLTILINSILTIIIHYLSLLRSGQEIDDDILSLGDDALQRLLAQIEEYIAAMRTTGVIPKYEISRIPSFAGFVYEPYSFVPEYRQKHLFALLYLDDDRENAGMTLSSYLLLYWKVPEMKRYIRNIMDVKDLREYDIQDTLLEAFNMGIIDAL